MLLFQIEFLLYGVHICKGVWESRFDLDLTKKLSFFISEEMKKKITMKQIGYFKFSENKKLKRLIKIYGK